MLSWCRIRPPGARAWRLPGPGGWLVTAHQTHAGDWEIAVRYGVTEAVPSDFAPGPADSEARGQVRWAGGIVWLGDLAGALAAARCAALSGFSGPQVRRAEVALFGEVGGPELWGRPPPLRRNPATARPGPDERRLPTEEMVAHRGQGVIPRTAGLPPHGTC